MRVTIWYESGYEKRFENVSSMDTKVTMCDDGKPKYEIDIFNRSFEHIKCHEVKSFEVIHEEYTWEHYKGGMRCPNCEGIAKIRYDNRNPLLYCPYCGSKNRRG